MSTLRLSLKLSLAALLGCSTCWIAHAQQPPASAGTQAVAPATTEVQPPAVDPAVLRDLDRMASYMRSLSSFELDLSSLTDELLDGDQTAQLGRSAMLKIRRPNGLQADLANDRGDRKSVFYNGQTTTVFDPQTKYYATVPSPDTIAGVADLLSGRYGIDLPGADLFYWDSKGFVPGQFKSAEFLGEAIVDGSPTNHYAFRQDGLDWQIWIQRGASPLPRRLVITTTVLAAKPQHSIMMRWNLSPRTTAGEFNFRPPAGAQRIVLQKADGSVDPADH
ncbi:DUF2092 domain-containing protein [Variovorax sp. GB1R11]|uniref:DUF2092 domain-containing protein n=1 Tax=Variovorax sp. GB1R11 TaxID=3443741 RepID=UPI003F45C3D6